jgi:hypothetical protein
MKAERDGNSGVAGEHNSFFFSCPLHVQGKKKIYGAVQKGTICFFFSFSFSNA